MTRRVVVVDDQEQIREVLRAYLERDGMEVVEAATGQEAITAVSAHDPAVVLLDLGLPDMDGLDVLRRIRAESDVYVMVVTARAEEVDKLVGLAVGADDYVTKPFSPREVAARVGAMMRRHALRATAATNGNGTNAHGGSAEAPSTTVQFDGLCIDEARRELSVDGRAVTPSALEFDLLAALCAEPGRVFSRRQLLEKVWGYDFYGDERVVDVHIRSLRQHLGDDATSPRFIGTVRGVGYKFVAERQ